MLRDRRLVLLLIALGVIVLVITTVIGFSGAYFTSTSRSPGNEFAAAHMGMDLSRTGEVVDAGGMVPGETRSGDQVVTNTGHRGTLVLDVVDLDLRSPLTDVLDVRVRQTQPEKPDAAYDGPLTGLDRLPLGTLAHAESRTYRISIVWPARHDSRRLEGTSTSFDLDWRLESVP